jgi:hypothetical protein
VLSSVAVAGGGQFRKGEVWCSFDCRGLRKKVCLGL